jgi:hypothetical protein
MTKLGMCLLPFTLLLSAPALAQTWSGTEGVCNDWTTQWTLRGPPGADGSFTADVVLNEHVAPCVPHIIGGKLQGTATGSIKGTLFTAHRVTNDNNTCDFSGHIGGGAIADSYHCSNGGPFRFTLAGVAANSLPEAPPAPPSMICEIDPSDAFLTSPGPVGTGCTCGCGTGVRAANWNTFVGSCPMDFDCPDSEQMKTKKIPK